ncbi:MAG: hypothetical protein L0H79_05965 [Intrasporangium sp.]|uniref:hypothetical protein n=1 Tax=Intrasporangium sp. TaxID=1925024 RepID=UPI0026482489|nr:hypothetical protein [Intrasporangium sp.]MDN5795284.1 hypothetical protein [Intrasporangium sp.]
MTTIDFLDPRVRTDFATFVSRARPVSVDGAVRIQTLGPMLVLTVAVLRQSGPLGEGSVLGMRIMPVAGGEPVETTVPIAAVADRLARRAGDGVTFALPPTTLSTPWAGDTPPRGGWDRVGEIDCTDLERVAKAGIEAITRGAPEGSGALAVDALRRRVWGAPTDTVPPVPAGMAFAAYTLGFTQQGEPASVTTHGQWTRLSTSRGHVLAR